MDISNIKLWNFRKFGSDIEYAPNRTPNLVLNFSKGLNVLIGENDSGKTAIIDAIKLVLKTHSYDYIRVDDADFYKNTERFRIELTFNDFTSDEAKNFTEWLGWTGTGETAKPFLRVIYDVSRKNGKIDPSDVTAGVDDDGYPLTAEAREYLKVTYLKPLRDAENELIAKRNSRLSQILIGDHAFKGKEKDHHLLLIFNKLKLDLEGYFKGEKIKTTGKDGNDFIIDSEIGKKLKGKIDHLIVQFYGNDFESLLESSSNDLKSILEKLTLSLKDELNPGLGTLNRLFMAAELLHLNKDNWTGIRLGLVEELEAHLHPQAQMQVIEALQKQEIIQLILTTHSPNLASKVKLENLILCEGKYAFPMGRKYTKLRETDYPFLERFLDVTKANLFFAKGVIIVEGAAEELIIHALAKKMCDLGIISKDLTSAKVSVVSINNTAFNRFGNIFKRRKSPDIKLPVAIVNDLDLRPIEYAIKYGIAGKRKKRQNIISEFDPAIYRASKQAKIDDQKVKAFISNHWTLEYCLALHPNLKKTLFEAIQFAIEENRADSYTGKNENKKLIRKIDNEQVDEEWAKFIHGKSDEQIAFDLLFQFIIDKKKLSKAVVAHYFSELLSKESTLTNHSLLIADNPIDYLVQAIKYATGY